jgi:hypothetical protein
VLQASSKSHCRYRGGDPVPWQKPFFLFSLVGVRRWCLNQRCGNQWHSKTQGISQNLPQDPVGSVGVTMSQT